MKFHFVLLDSLDVIRRRKLFFFAPMLSILLIGVGIALFLPSEYESHATLLVRQETAVIPGQATSAPGDQLAIAEETIRSRTTIAALMDSLGESPTGTNDAANAVREENIRERVMVTRRGEDSFRITATAGTPDGAQRMASILTGLFIRAITETRMQQIDEAIRFYEGRIEEYRRSFEGPQSDPLTAEQTRLRGEPQGEVSSRLALERVEAELRGTQRVLDQQERVKSLLRSYAEGIDDPGTVSQISTLPAEGAIVYINELKSLSVRYNELLSRYTMRYPEVQSVRRQLLNLLEKSGEAMDAEIGESQERRGKLVAQKNRILRSLSAPAAADDGSGERRTEQSVQRDLYDGMKLQLEQLKISRRLGENAGPRVVILDRPQIPVTAVRPVRGLIVGIAALAGFLCGVIGLVLSESFDPTVRRPQDLEIFQKPIIASLP